MLLENTQKNWLTDNEMGEFVIQRWWKTCVWSCFFSLIHNQIRTFPKMQDWNNFRWRYVKEHWNKKTTIHLPISSVDDLERAINDFLAQFSIANLMVRVRFPPENISILDLSLFFQSISNSYKKKHNSTKVNKTILTPFLVEKNQLKYQ